jgi:hypothetical protein
MSTNPNSILDTVKKVLGFESEYTAFDLDITMFINAAFGSLLQLGVGPGSGFLISDNTTLWSQYTTELSYLGMVQNYIFMSCKLAFDPPATSFGIDAIKNQLLELTWRINIAAETIDPPSDPTATICGDLIPMTGVLKGWFAPKVKNLDFASVVNINAHDGNVFYLELTANCTINAPTNGEEGQHITLELISNGFSVTWGEGWNFGAPGSPVLSSGGETDIISSVYRTVTTDWYTGFSPGF